MLTSIIGVIFLLYRFLPDRFRIRVQRFGPYFFLSFLWLSTFFLLLQLGFPEAFSLGIDKTAGLSTYSITDTDPHVYIPETLNDKTIIISEDMGMRDIFPTFTMFLDTKMQDRKFSSFYVSRPYHYAAYSKKESHPVTLYKTIVKELKQRLANQK